MRTAALALALAIAATGLGPATSRAQGAAPAVGAEVRDDKGKPVGRVERIVEGPDGKPRQVMVRVDRVLRTLPVEALRPAPGGYVAVLTRAEIAALPPSE